MKKKIIALLCFVSMSSLLFGFQSDLPNDPKRVSIIIDDLGNNLKGTDELFAIKAPLTVAIMPLLPSSKTDAHRAKQAGFEVLLHLPMEFTKGKKEWLGPGAITTDMSSEAIKQQVRKDLDSIPNVKGINNHMGSKATSDERVMRAVLEVVKERGLFFVDSATSSQSKGRKVANDLRVPYIKRDVFLDNIHTQHAIEKQITEMVSIGKIKGESVAIGHVGLQGHHTMSAIRAMLPVIQKERIQIVPISTLLTQTK